MKEDFMSFAAGQISDSIGSNTFVKYKKKKKEDKYKDKFLNCISLIEASFQRSLTVGQLGIDMSEYEAAYWETIDTMLYLLFKDETIIEAVNYYVYDKIDPEGEVMPYYDPQMDAEFTLASPEDLWDLIIQKLEAKDNANNKTNK
jgi:hypothetical protein